MNKTHALVFGNKLKPIIVALLIATVFTGMTAVVASYAESDNAGITSELPDVNIESDYEISLKDIEMHEGVTTDIHLKVFVNEMNPSSGDIIFAIHGGMHTANTYKPFAEALFNDELGRKVSMVIAIDMPGHGKSTVSPSNELGNLTYNDYVQATLVSLKRLNNDLHLQPETIIGHSMGGLVIQMMQQALKDEGTNLEKAFKIKNVVLFAPAPPRELDFPLILSFDMVSLINNFMIDGYPSYEEELLAKSGPHFVLPDFVWPGFFFIKYDDGLISEKAPTPEEVSELGYNAPEPLYLIHVIGYDIIGSPDPDYPYWGPEDFLLDNDIRPSVDRGVFGPGAKTNLFILGYTQDVLIRPMDSENLYEYLTGDGNKKGSIVIESDEMHDTVHDLHVSDPGYLLDSIRGIVKLS